MRTTLRFSLFLVPLAALVVAGVSLSRCEKKVTDKKKNVVAQVGDALLTTDDLRGRFPREYENLVTRAQYYDYIQRWMDEEVLYQEARARGIEELPEVKVRIRDQAKRIVVEAYLQGEGEESPYHPDEIAIQQYYDAHSDQFLRSEPEVRFADIFSKSSTVIWEARRKVTESNFLELLRQYSEGEKPANLEAPRFYKAGELSPCLAAAVFDIKIGGTTPPLSCDDGYHIVRILDKKPAGTPRPLEDVREEVKSLLIHSWRDQQLDGKIRALKEKIYYYYDLTLVPGRRDTPVTVEPGIAGVEKE